MSFRGHSSSVPSRGSYHRRAQSEVQFRIPDDFDLDLAPFDDDRHVSFEDLGSEDDFFRASTDFDNSRSKLQLGPSSAPKPEFGGESSSNDNGNGGKVENSGEGEKAGRPRHRHCNSTDEFSGLEAIEAKKAMAPDKLAELWTIDPKRAKRILANRQSAARSKERKARYVLELERKIQTLQTEATTLSAQLNLFQRDTNGLTTENTELKLQLQAMEQQAKLCDAVNDALKKEVDRLKFATGETISPSDTFRLGMHQMSYPQASFFSHQPQHGPIEPQTMQIQQLHPLPSNLSNSHQPRLPAANPHDSSEMLPQDSLGQFQELEIDSRGSHFVMLDCPSAMAFDI